jgi:hypothetical protein
MSTNFGAVADDYALFRTGFPDSFFDRLASAGFCKGGTTVVHVGTGTGTLARGFARRGASLDPTNIQAFDASLAQTFDESFPGDVLQVTHRVFAVLARPG